MSTQRREGIDHTSGAGGSLGWRNVWNLAADGNLKTLKRLQRSELLAHVNDTDHAQKTALHYAAYAGRAETCEFLQQCGAAIDVADAQGKTPPDLARERRHVEVARQLEGFEAREAARLRREREEREAEVRRREAEAVARAARVAREAREAREEEEEEARAAAAAKRKEEEEAFAAAVVGVVAVAVVVAGVAAFVFLRRGREEGGAKTSRTVGGRGARELVSGGIKRLAKKAGGRTKRPT